MTMAATDFKALSLAFRVYSGKDALEIAFPRLREAWGAHGQRPVSWPLSVRAFRL